MRLVIAALVCFLPTLVFSKLPPPTEEAKAKAAEANAKTAWSDKVGLYKLCISMDQTAAAYRKSAKATGKPVPAPVPTPPCTDPSSFVAQSQITPETSKPLEAAGAHSPTGAAISPPNTNATAAEIAVGGKK